MAKQKYWSCDKLRKTNANYLMPIGERSNGKSYAVKDMVLKEFAKNGKQFVLVRRTESELKKSDIEKYFADNSLKMFKEEIFITAKGRDIYTACMNEETGGVKLLQKIGYSMALTKSQSYKSQAYPLVDNMIFEEFIAENGRYLPNELDALMSIVSTVFRRRKASVWLIGNKISRLCPYFYEWGLTNIPKQEMGTIDIYRHDTGRQEEDGTPIQITIAVENCANSGQNEMMAIGKSAKMIACGEWQTQSFDKLPVGLDYEELYPLFIEWNDRMFKVLYCCDSKVDFLYVKPFTRRALFDYSKNRVMSNLTHHSPLYTYGLEPCNEIEKRMFDIMNKGLVYYSDNLTGTEFHDIKRMFKTLLT